MARIWIVNRDKGDDSTESVRNYLRIQSGLNETLNPRDIGLRTIDFFLATSASVFGQTAKGGSNSFVVGSLYAVVGTPERTGSMSGVSKSWGGLGSGVLLRWVTQTNGTPAAGTSVNRGAGTKTMNAFVIGRI